MPVQNGTATDHNDLLADLVAFLTTAGPSGPGWTTINTSGGSYLMRAPGISGLEQIGMGFSVVGDVGTDSFALRGWMHRDYNAALGHEAQPGHSGVRFHPIWNTSIPYWFIANGQRVVIVTKISTVYTASYLGKYLPLGAPGEYPQPYYLGMPRASNTRWSSTNENFRNFYDPGEGGLVLTPSVSWLECKNFAQLTGEASNTLNAMIWPFNGSVAGSTQAQTRYRELRENIDGSYNLKPLVILSNDPSDDVFGELDGCFAINAFSAASEDVVDIGGDDYLIVQSCFRTERYYYAAIKLT